MAQADRDRQRRISAWYKEDERRTVAQAARLFHVDALTVKRALAATKTPINPKHTGTEERDEKIREKRAAGRTLAEIGSQHRLTRQRVHQICAQ